MVSIAEFCIIQRIFYCSTLTDDQLRTFIEKNGNLADLMAAAERPDTFRAYMSSKLKLDKMLLLDLQLEVQSVKQSVKAQPIPQPPVNLKIQVPINCHSTRPNLNQEDLRVMVLRKNFLRQMQQSARFVF